MSHWTDDPRRVKAMECIDRAHYFEKLERMNAEDRGPTWRRLAAVCRAEALAVLASKPVEKINIPDVRTHAHIEIGPRGFKTLERAAPSRL